LVIRSHQSLPDPKERQMNSVTMIGRLTREPEARQRGRRTASRLRIAVGHRPHPTTYIDVDILERRDRTRVMDLGMGDLVWVTGMPAHDEWRARDGALRVRHRVVGVVELLARSEKNPERAQEKEQLALF
jgi:single-stranded DNA-binding protein